VTLEEKEHDRLTEATEIIFYEMPKLEQKVRDIQAGKLDINSLPEDEKWCIYFRYRHEEQTAELIKKLYRKEEGIMRAERAVAGIDRDYLRAIRKMGEIKNSMDRAQEKYEARREGRAEGLQEGLQEKSLEIARKMKDAGRPLNEIAEFTGLATETIYQL